MQDLVPVVATYTTLAQFSKSTQNVFSTTKLGAIRTAGVEPAFYELSRSSRVFGLSLAVGNAVACVQTVPTTTATFYLHNNAATGSTRCLVPLLIGAYLGSGTAAAGMTVMATVTTANTVSPPTANGTGYTITGLNGTGTSVALGKSSQTIPSGSVWVQIASSETTADTNPGTGCLREANGMFVVRPGFGLGVAVLSGAGTSAAYCPSIIWAEIETDIDQ